MTSIGLQIVLLNLTLFPETVKPSLVLAKQELESGRPKKEHCNSMTDKKFLLLDTFIRKCDKILHI